MTTSTLRPGILVALNTSIKGNVRYAKQTIEADNVIDAGDGTKVRKAKWETERTIQDADEHDRAVVVRTKVRTLIGSVCNATAFGLLCREDREAQLDEAVAEARKVADAFNATARLSRVRISIIKGRIAPDDVQAVKAINEEVRGLLATMSEGLKNLDVTVVRDAANRARSLGQMLADGAAERVKEAVEAARKAARKIAAAGEQGAIEIDKATLETIEKSRTAFLEVEGNDEVAAPTEEARAIDLTPSTAPAFNGAVPVAAPEIELAESA